MTAGDTRHATRATQYAIRSTLHVSRFTFYVSLLFAALLTAAWSPGPQTGTITVTGQVANGTPDASVPVDLPITLHVFSEAAEETAVYTTAVAADGAFAFTDVSPEGGETLVTRAAYQGVTYTSAFTTTQAEQQEVSLPLSIYETTEDVAAVSITQLHVFVSRTEDRVQVGEYALIGNAGHRTYVGQPDPKREEWTTLAFGLPEDAENLRFDGGGLKQRFVEREDGFADTRPIPPGDATVEVSFSYEIPYREGMPVEQAFDVPVKSIVMIVPGSDLALEGEGVTSQGTIDTQMGPALSYTAGPLEAGEPLAFNVVPAPAGGERGGAEERRSGGAGGVALGLAALAAAAVGVYLLWRSPAPGPIPAQVQSQVEAIAALDADFEAGQISEKAYRKKRRSLKREVREMLGDL